MLQSKPNIFTHTHIQQITTLTEAKKCILTYKLLVGTIQPINTHSFLDANKKFIEYIS